MRDEKEGNMMKSLLTALFGALVLTTVSCIAFLAGGGGQTAIWGVAPAIVALIILIVAISMVVRRQKQEAAAAQAAEDLTAGKQVDMDALRAAGALGKCAEALVQEVRRQQGLIQGVLVGLPMPYLLTDTQERITMTNQETMDMLEIDGKPESQYGRTLAEVFYNDSTRQTAVGKAINNGQVFSNLEVTIAGHKGGQRHVLANVYPIYDLDKKCVGGFCLYLDMTKLKEKEQEICSQNELIGRAASRATAVAESMASASDELAAQVEQTRVSSEQQRESTTDAASAIEQMSASIMEVAGNAREVTELADSSRAKASEGAAEVERTRKVILGMRDEAQTLMQDMEGLGEQANEIGKVLNVINDIADQTNLLALNAAIEAARAGEAGRGFAVVADEVRKLAEKTMQATKEVGGVVQAIQASAAQSKTSTESVVASVGQGVDSAKPLARFWR